MTAQPRSDGRTWLRPLLWAFTLLPCALVYAGGPPPNPFPPGQLPNENQLAVGDGIYDVCIALPSPTNADMADLQTVCGDILATASNLGFPGGGPGGTPIPGIDTPEELGNALQQIGTEEQAAAGTNGVETARGRAVLSRLADVRAGAAGVSVSDLRLGIDGQFVSAGDFVSAAHANAAPDDGSSVDASIHDSERLGAFVNGSIGLGDRDGTAFENGMDFTVPGLTAGVDYRLGTAYVVGGAVGWERFDGDYDPSAVVAGGSLESDMLSLAGYGSYNAERFHVDGYLSYGWNDYETERLVVVYPTDPTQNRAARSETDGTQYELTGTVGYDGIHGSMQYTPYLRASLVNIDIDGFTETDASGLNLAVEDQEIESLISVAGAQLAWTFSGRAVLTPYVRGEWYHEFDNDSRAIVARYAADPNQLPFSIKTDEPDEDYFALGGGVASVWKGGTQAFADLDALIGLDDITSYRATAGVRWAF